MKIFILLFCCVGGVLTQHLFRPVDSPQFPPSIQKVPCRVHKESQDERPETQKIREKGSPVDRIVYYSYDKGIQ